MNKAKKSKKIITITHQEKLVLISKVLSPTFGVMYYLFGILALLLVMTAIIVAFVNVPVEDMMLPPFMRSVMKNSEIEGYNIMVGNGIKLYAQKENVELGDIKTVIYAGIMISVAVLLTMAPIFRFLSRIMHNVARHMPLEKKNGRLVSYIGLTILIGDTAILFVSRFYNYLLVKTFVIGGENIDLSLGVSLSGIFIGLLILLIGAIYSYGITFHNEQVEIINVDSGSNIIQS